MPQSAASLIAWPLTLGQDAPPVDDSMAPSGVAAPAASDNTTGTTPGIPAAPGDQTNPTPQPSPLGSLLLPLALMLGVIMIFSMSSGRKEKKKRAEMLNQLVKGARVQTVGGIKGTVIDVRDADDEVVVKVDEKSNTSLRFSRGSITSVVQDS